MTESRDNARLEAFCDGVFAIALTLLIIDVKLPSTEGLRTDVDVWRALQHLAPTIFAFVLSFGVILVTWVNHHGALRLVHKASPSFMYANGFLLLTVVFIPFPASLLGEFVLTDHAAPAVVLYNAVLALQGIAWISLAGSVLKNKLARDEKALATFSANRRNGLGGVALYVVLAALAFWFPLTAAIITGVSWIFWLTLSIRLKHS